MASKLVKKGTAVVGKKKGAIYERGKYPGKETSIFGADRGVAARAIRDRLLGRKPEVLARKKLGPQAGRVRASLSGVRPTPKAGKGK